jgi:putative membrane protein insertion efficiency factor
MIRKFLIKILKLYKKYLSKPINASCIFTPTCSEYAMEAIEKRNLFIAFLLIIWRLLRCNSINKGGFDPVPDSKEVTKWII